MKVKSFFIILVLIFSSSDSALASYSKNNKLIDYLRNVLPKQFEEELYNKKISKEWCQWDLDTKNITETTIQNNDNLQSNLLLLKHFKKLKIYKSKSTFRAIINTMYVLDDLTEIFPGEISGQIVAFAGYESFANKRIFGKKYSAKPNIKKYLTCTITLGVAAGIIYFIVK